MTYTYNDCLQFIPDLNSYTQKKINNDWWQDVVQDTLIYLYLKFDNLIITNPKGIVINTATFFIKKYYSDTSNNKLLFSADIEKDFFNIKSKDNHSIKIGQYNSFLIDDQLACNLNSISKTLFTPFKLQLNGLSIKEISEALGSNENTIKTRIRRCKEELKRNVFVN